MEKVEEILDKISTFSIPSALKITDLKICKVNIPPWGCHIIKIETNQGLTGYGEMRDGASPTYVKLLKSRILGENPCDVERIFKKISQFGSMARQSAGIAAIEIALWDLVGKAYQIPVYQLLGGKQREKIRLYADAHIEKERFSGEVMQPEKVGKLLKGHMDAGFSALKILSVELLMYQKGNVSGATDWLEEFWNMEQQARKAGQNGSVKEKAEINAKLYDYNNLAHPFTNLHVTEQGLDCVDEYIGRIRKTIGYEIPLAIDHFGHFPLIDMVKIARRLEKYNLLWLEDMLPWYLTEQYKSLAERTEVSLATGEDIYLADNFRPLLESGALAMVHPDLLTVGGILETKKLSTLASQYGASMSIHMCESPIACIAAAHAAMASENFFALEYDALDMPWWEDLMDTSASPLGKNGHIMLSDAPGLGIQKLNEEVMREHADLVDGELWMSTDEWNCETSLDRSWS